MRRLGLLACLGFGLSLGLAACSVPSKPAQTFVVFFAQWSAKLDDPARNSVKVAAAWAKSHPAETIIVVGYIDPPGALPANIDYARRRSQLVVDQLVADGVPAGRIGRGARGPEDYTLSFQEDRRVEIQID
jgi:outer membrane protein OmpA-like peptidoglycan-associated protein